MQKILPILAVLAVLTVLGLVCSAGGSGLLDNASHVIAAQSNLEAIKTIKFQASTINNLAYGYIAALAVMAFVLISGFIFSWKIIGRLSDNPAGPRDHARWLDAGGAPKFIALGDDARVRLRRLSPAQRMQLLERLYVVCSWLEQDLGYPRNAGYQKEMVVYEKRPAEVDTITWG